MWGSVSTITTNKEQLFYIRQPIKTNPDYKCNCKLQPIGSSFAMILQMSTIAFVANRVLPLKL